jgi:hypothetical protein
MYRLIRTTFISSAGALLLLMTQPAAAQLTGVLNYWNPATGNWNVPSNWSLNTLPNGASSDDFAVIGGTGTGGTPGISVGAATIDSAITDMPGGITLGAAAGNSGTLQISSGGSITVATTPFNGNGNVYVGVGGTGTLNIDRGGSLTAVALNEGGNAASSVRLGNTTGSGSAVVVVGDANLPRITRVVGPNVDFTSNNLNLGTAGTLIAQITSATHSALKANDNAVLGGTVSFEFDPSITPTLGNTWDLINARQVVSAFDTVNVSSAPPLPLGQVYNVRTQSGGLGKLVQLAVEQRLVLNVSRATHDVSISNPGGPAGIAIDGYSVRSAALTALNPANFVPLGGTWQVANSTTSRVNQLNPSAAPTFSTGSTTSLGSIFAPPTPVAFGTQTEDLSFEYTQTDGSIRTGVVNYLGTYGVNNLVLRVDPTTGAAQLRNTSPFSVDIDNYTISSTFGSLDTTQWSSLDDQNAAGGDWQEANISASRISELKFAGSTAFGSGQFFNIGNPFNEVTGKRDLTFQFLLHGETTARTGVIVYESLSATVPGDYNGNGIVDAGDYVLWRKNPSSYGGAGGYTTWRNNFGATPGGGSSVLGAQAVPEPASCMLMVVALGLVFSAVLREGAFRRAVAPCMSVLK